MKLAYMGWRHRLTPRKSREQATTRPSPAINFAIRRPPCTQIKNGHKKCLINYEQNKMLREENQCCGSGMLIPDPDFCPSRIPDPKTATKEKGEKKFVVLPFFVATNITKIINYFISKQVKKKLWTNFYKEL
jgi:hypothetical protein